MERFKSAERRGQNNLEVNVSWRQPVATGERAVFGK